LKGWQIFESGHHGSELRSKEKVFVIHAISYIGSSGIKTKANDEFYIG
jgi:hypothetical protein